MGIEIDLVALRSSLRFLTHIRFPLDPSPCHQQHCSASLSTVSTRGKLQPSLPSTSPKPTLIQSRYGSSLQPPVIPATQCSRPAHAPAHQTRMGYTPRKATQVLSQGTYFREKQGRKDTASFCLAMSVCLCVSLCLSLSLNSLPLASCWKGSFLLTTWEPARTLHSQADLQVLLVGWTVWLWPPEEPCSRNNNEGFWILSFTTCELINMYAYDEKDWSNLLHKIEI